VSIFAYDYSGYGLSSKIETNGNKSKKHEKLKRPPPSEQFMCSDIEAVYRYMREELEIQWFQIVLYGQSVGTAPTIDLASYYQFPCLGIILHSPLVSALTLLSKTVKLIKSTICLKEHERMEGRFIYE
jgi:abhydrolase domain-containing protein 17